MCGGPAAPRSAHSKMHSSGSGCKPKVQPASSRCPGPWKAWFATIGWSRASIPTGTTIAAPWSGIDASCCGFASTGLVRTAPADHDPGCAGFRAELADPAMDAAAEAEPGYGVVGAPDQLGAGVEKARVKADQAVLRVEAQADQRRSRVCWWWRGPGREPASINRARHERLAQPPNLHIFHLRTVH